MKGMNALVSITILAFTSAASFGVAAQAGMDRGKMGDAKMEQSAAEMTDGEVRKVDKDARKITLRHGAIKNLDMPPMTMVFQIKDPAVLEKVQQGDKVKFKAAMSGGAMVVTEIQVSK
jgi:Cu/Ag efflux protein CusF